MTEGPRLVGVRNSLVIVGAYYVSSWILVPFGSLWLACLRERVYLPGEAGLVEARNLIPVVISAVLAGVACGWFIETKRLLVWALACGVFVGVCKWSSGVLVSPTERRRADSEGSCGVCGGGSRLRRLLGCREASAPGCEGPVGLASVLLPLAPRRALGMGAARVCLHAHKAELCVPFVTCPVDSVR